MTIATVSKETRTRGRPRQFDMDTALDKALRVFSERGYHAASISELTEAMEVAAGSVYKAFRDKRGIFLAAFDRYRAVRLGLLDARLAKVETGRDKLREVLASYVISSHGESGRRGCLVVGSANELALFDEEAANRVAAAFATDEASIAELIRLGQRDGSISSEIDASATARALVCLTKGMRVVGKTGPNEEDMASVAEIALKLLT
ncbi:TetR/AcrR family transcriptional regulator [Rhizobium sp. Root1220]|uniref:TetR/AcrR family transcriptional regulator n=1 Tax=Rhizobium sp. Root1220 TaxID=1736432 RepID=UPI0006FEB3ED|nr:TetR/AcrR family transcriptional regulator [Rhizobium sp. Root1220]KQV82089.1 TetR family transcriptional regulator [Rhizobium sp. Root1220]